MEYMIENAKDAFNYICGGKGKFTVASKKTGKRFTYKARQYNDKNLFNEKTPVFISVLNGPDNTSDYRYIGCILKNKIGLHAGKKGLPTADSYRALDWIIKSLHAIGEGNVPSNLEFYHKGNCGRCGRELTVPESILSGMGPVCAGKN